MGSQRVGHDQATKHAQDINQQMSKIAGVDPADCRLVSADLTIQIALLSPSVKFKPAQELCVLKLWLTIWLISLDLSFLIL